MLVFLNQNFFFLLFLLLAPRTVAADDQPAPDPARCFDCPPVDPAPAAQ